MSSSSSLTTSHAFPAQRLFSDSRCTAADPAPCRRVCFRRCNDPSRSRPWLAIAASRHQNSSDGAGLREPHLDIDLYGSRTRHSLLHLYPAHLPRNDPPISVLAVTMATSNGENQRPPPQRQQSQGLPSISSLTNGLPAASQRVSSDQLSPESTRDSGTWPQPHSKRESYPANCSSPCVSLRGSLSTAPPGESRRMACISFEVAMRARQTNAARPRKCLVRHPGDSAHCGYTTCNKDGGAC